MSLNKNIKILVNYVAGPFIMLFLFLLVSRQLHHQPHWRESIDQIWKAATGSDKWKLYVMFSLMLVNWGLESLKWKIALATLQPVGYLTALKGTFAGACIASFTPNRVGEFLGRMFFVDPGNKLLSIAPAILCSMAQMLITLITGSFGLFLYSRLPLNPNAGFPIGLKPSYDIPLLILTIGSALVLGLLYFGFDPLVNRVNLWLKKNKKSFSIPENFNISVTGQLLFVSFLRYTIFILQYFLLFNLFDIPLTGLQVFTGVSVMFVIMAVVPTLTILTDIGFRWAAGIAIFQVFTTNIAGIMAVSLGIWIFNLIIPALIGSLLILRIKLFSSR